ncbi:MAG: 2-C-methyl-D-erythritol 2,4-cyclodiphosphate synthase [Bacteroidetes bacterium]|nr:2-C-methyl-D-erythritol 2,4-cyclodiphosphate synthase [Bacteroidota bacterium]
MDIRVGIGYDVHRLEEGYKLFIGGVKVPYEKGAVGHSDADVLIHAIMDALLGAAALRDIGFHFPDTDNSYKGIDSKVLLKKVKEILDYHNWAIVNIDTVICLQAPKISSLIPDMQQKIADVLGLEPDKVSIKATTTEKLGFIGRGEGISAQAVCLIAKK